MTGDLGLGNNHGAASWHHTVKRGDMEDAAAGSGVPTSQFYSEGNGGEFRKSYHGYPRGYAQLIESPEFFHIQPMQIDTKNRHYNGSDFKPDLLPKVRKDLVCSLDSEECCNKTVPPPQASAAPADAAYSGLLECPCTDRVVKKVRPGVETVLQKVPSEGS